MFKVGFFLFFLFFGENGRVNAGVTKGCIIYRHGEIVIVKWLSSPAGHRSARARELHPLLMQQWGRVRNDTTEGPLASNI